MCSCPCVHPAGLQVDRRNGTLDDCHAVIGDTESVVVDIEKATQFIFDTFDAAFSATN